MTFEEWAREEYDDDINWQWFLTYEGDQRKAWNAGIEAAAELVYGMDFMANEHVAKLIRGLKGAKGDE